jgi:VCBS repeat-containing protein
VPAVDNGSTITMGRPDLGIRLIEQRLPIHPPGVDPGIPGKFNQALTWRQVYDPLALDLAGDGFQTVGEQGAGTVLFDHNGDGVRGGTGWLASGRDAWVVLDRNGDGLITTGNELFGVDTLLPGGAKAPDGFAAVAPLDTNHDGKVNANDAPLAAWQIRADLNGDGIIGGDEFRAVGFGDLKLWRDTNQNGFSEPFELQSLADAGIASVNLDSVADGRLLGAGNSLARRGTFTRTDGTTGTSGALDLVNVSFFRDFATPPIFDPAVAFLPTSRGSGGVRDLLQAASGSSELRLSLESTASAPTRAQQRAGIDDLLHKWADNASMLSGTRAAAERPDHSVLSYSFFDVPLTMSVRDAYLAAAAEYRAAHPGTTGPIDVRDLPASWFEARQSQEYRDRVAMIETLERFIGQTFVNTAGAQSFVAYSEFVPASGTTPAHTFTVNSVSSIVGGENWFFLKDAYQLLQESAYGSVAVQTRLHPYVQAATAGIATQDFSAVEALLAAKRVGNPGEALVDIVELGKYLGTQLVDRGWLNLPQMIGAWSREALANPALAAVVSDLNIKARDNLFLTGSLLGDVLIGTNWVPDFFTTAPNRIDAREGNDIILGGSVFEEIRGNAGDDIIDVGTGGKTVFAGVGRDTIFFGRGAGAVAAQPFPGEPNSPADRDRLQFLPGIAPQDVIVKRMFLGLLPANQFFWNMIFRIAGTTDTFTDTFFFSEFSNQNGPRTIDEVRFADGTVWDLATILNKAIEGTDGNDSMLGYDTDDTIDGKAGSDFIDGGFGNDSLIGGSGDDQLFDGGFLGGSGNDTLDGGTGNDTLRGGLGGDTYVFGFGYGQDQIFETSSTGDIDTLKILANPGDVILASDPSNLSNLVFGLKGTDDGMRVDWFNNPSARIERVVFADGTTWDISGANVLVGTDGVSTNLTGGAGGDLLVGGNLNDTLAGGAGNDTLSGGAGDDTYLFNIGNGVDHIQDVAALGEGNTLQFGAGITQDMLSLALGSLLIRVGPGGDAVHLDAFDPSNVAGAHAVETFRFADGSSLSYAGLIARGFDLSGTDGNEIVTGTSVTDRIDGKAGNDTLIGGAGSDTYAFGLGSGQDLIREASSSSDTDTLRVLANPADVTVTRETNNLVVSLNGTSDRVAIDWFTDPSARIERVTFANGTVWDAATLQAQAGGQVNHAPVVATPIADQSATEDSAFSFTVPASTFTDADAGDTLTYSSTLSNGSALPSWLSFNPVTRMFSGTPANGNVGTVSVKVVATDGQGAAAFDVFDLGVANTNDAPVAVADSVSVNENGTTANLVPVLLANDTDVDAGDTRRVSAVNTTGTVGSVAFNAATQSLTYSANAASQDALRAGQTVTDSFTYTVADTAGATSTAAVTVTVTGVNDAPVAVANSVAVNENATTSNLVTTLLANDTDVDAGDTRSITAVNTTGTVGSVAFNATTQSLTYSANAAQDALRAGQTATDSFTYTIADAASATSTATVNVTVTGVNDAPVAVANSVAVNENATTANLVATLLANDTDVDSGDTRSVTAVNTAGTIGAVAFNAATQTLTYSANAASQDALRAGQTATDSFTYTIADAAGATSTATVNVTVTGVNDAPILANQTATQSATANQAFSLALPANTFTDVDAGDTLTYSGTLASGAALPSWLTFNATTRTFAGTPAQGDVGTASVKVIATDTQGAIASDVFNISVGAAQGGIVGTAGNDTLVGTAAADTISGLAGNDMLTGGAGNDTLDGGTGADTMAGGLGNDTYLADDFWDVVTENANEGTDTVQSFEYYYGLEANVENLTLTGTAAFDGGGNALNNLITGNSNSNRLDGGAGADTMVGGLGGDTYYVDNVSDVVTENANEGTDTVESLLTYTLGTNLENLTLAENFPTAPAINGTGNALDNYIKGNHANNRLTGGAGNDTLDGSYGGVDTLVGGTGNDLYIVDSTSDVVTENANEGTDTVQSYVSWTLGANFENLTLLSGNGTGNALDNVIIGSVGDNTLNGGGGADTFMGGGGNDTFIVDSVTDVVTENANQGIDTVRSSVTYTLGANVDNLTLTGTSAINGTGNALDNVLTGNSAANTLTGGLGNDTYVVGAGDIVVENANEGIDTIQTALTYTLGANLENLTLTGTSAINGTGNALDNVLTGNSAANTLTGGTGNDTYVVGTGDTVVENANEGTDTVQSSATWTLGANFENLTLTGTSAINGTGNALDNVLIGNSAANTLTGGAGNDTYFVSSGDTVVEAAGGGTDSVFSDASFTLGANIENLTLVDGAPMSGTGNALNNTLIANSYSNTLDGGAGADTMIGGAGGDTYYVDNVGDVVVEDSSGSGDSVFSSLSYTLGVNVENLTLTGTAAVNGTGNALDNILTGNVAANILTGGLGNDTYGVDNVDDVVIENPGEGIDTVLSTVSYTLGATLENLSLQGGAAINGTGNDLDNTLSGNGGVNVLTGGRGNDTYRIFSNDVVVENAGEGIDLVIVDSVGDYTLAANLENLNFFGGTGTGNALDNVLSLSAPFPFAAVTLVGLGGNDTLDASRSVSTVNMLGGTGDDTYIVNSTANVVTENANEGNDTVQSSTTLTLANNVENLILISIGPTNGTGNTLNNLVRGNIANNTLNGAEGFDVLEGGVGDDTLTDTSGGNYLNGGAGTDTLTGGTSADFFMGGVGNDTLSTGNGADVIAFNVGDGQDSVNPSVGTDDTISLGGSALSYANLTFQKTGNNLILNVSATDKITFTNWYAASANKNVLNLQVVAEAMAGFNPAGGNTLLDNKVERFNFQNLVGAFDAALAANPGLSSWALTNGLTQFQLAGSNTAALGGDLAYQYGLNGTLAGIGFNKAQDVLTSAQFGTQAQTLRPLATLQDGFVPLS